MPWSNDNVLEFLELYKKEQILWDSKHPHHRNRSEVHDAWVRIQQNLNIECSVMDIKRKKESLMTAFRSHCHKKKTQKNYKPCWFAYQLMETFLGGKYECDSTNTCTNETTGNECTTTASSVYYLVPQATKTSTTEETSWNVNTRDRIQQSVAMKRPSANQLPQQSVIELKTTNQNEIYHATDQNMAATTYLKQAEDKRGNDEYDLYGQLLATKLRKLGERQRDMAMHEIDNIMFRAKMQSGTSADCQISPPNSTSTPRKVISPGFILAPQNHNNYEDENIKFQVHDSLQPQKSP